MTAGNWADQPDDPRVDAGTAGTRPASECPSRDSPLRTGGSATRACRRRFGDEPAGSNEFPHALTTERNDGSKAAPTHRRPQPAPDISPTPAAAESANHTAPPFGDRFVS